MSESNIVQTKRRGRKKVETKIQEDMSKTLKMMTKLVMQNSKRLDILMAERVPAEGIPSARQVEVPEYVAPHIPPDEGAPAVIFKSPHRGMKQIIFPSRKIPRGADDYEIIPPVIAEFTDGTLRESDPERIEGIRAKIARKRRKGIPVDIIEVKDEIAAALKDPKTDVKGIANPNVNPEDANMQKMEDGSMPIPQVIIS